MNFSQLSAFKTFLFTYSAIILIPIITSVIVYISLLSIINDYNNEVHLAALSQYQQATNQYLDSVSHITEQILDNQDTLNFTSEDIFNKSSVNYQPSTTVEIMGKLNSYVSSNYILDNIYLYSFSNNLFLTANTSIASNNYGSFFRIGDMDFQTLETSVLKNYGYNKLYPQTSFTVNSVSKDCFYYVTTLPTSNHSLVNGCLIISVDTSKLFNTIKAALPSQSGYLYIYDAEQQLISSSAGAPLIENTLSERTEETIDGVSYVIYRTVEPGSYNYAVAIPGTAVSSGIAQPKLIMIILILVSCIICGALVLYFAKLNAKPIQEIWNTLKPYSDPQDKDFNEYHKIRSTTKHLIDSDTKTKELLREHMPILQSTLVHSILYGTLTDPDKIHQQLNQLNLNSNDPYYTVLIVSIIGLSFFSEDSVSKQMYIRTQLNSSLKSEFYCLNADINETDTIYILGIKNPDSSITHLENIINTVIGNLEKKFDFSVKASLSSLFESISDTVFHYQEVKSNMEQGIQTNYHNIVWCSKNSLAATGYYYPSNIEERIITSFQKGNMDIVCSTLDTVKEKNCNEYIMSSQTQSYLYANIVCTLSKILYSSNMTSSFIAEAENKIKCLRSMGIDDFFKKTKELVNSFHDVLSEQLQLNSAEAMLNYIDLHYKDPSLGRQSFSEHFHISEVYTSNFFKKHTGYRFTEYVTKVRMDAACDLLKNSSLTINKIAGAVGYNSDTSFRRVFISYTGMTPKEYRIKYSVSNDDESNG